LNAFGHGDDIFGDFVTGPDALPSSKAAIMMGLFACGAILSQLGSSEAANRFGSFFYGSLLASSSHSDEGRRRAAHRADRRDGRC
jgi:hypothetical protein